MKLVLECEVESRTILPQPLSIMINGREMFFKVNENGVWNSIKVVAPVSQPKLFKWGLEPTTPLSPQHAPVNMHAVYDAALYEAIIADLQGLESTLAMIFPVRRIRWNNPKVNILFESDEEANPPDWWSLEDFRISRADPQPMKAKLEEFPAFALLSGRCRRIMISQSFWREGNNANENGNFINAFYNFYFVLEGLYGNGKTKNPQVLEQFRRSSELRESLEKYMSEKHPHRFMDQVKVLLKRMNKQPNIEGFLHILVHTRGDLHHFVDNPNKIQPSPFKDEDFEGLADLARHLANVVFSVKWKD